MVELIYKEWTNMTERKWHIGMVVLLFVFIVANGRTLFLQWKNPVCLEGIYIEGVAVGGKTKEEVQKQLQNSIEKWEKYTFSLAFGAVKTKKITLKELGFSTNLELIVEDAFAQGSILHPIRTYQRKKQFQKNPKQYKVQIQLQESLLKEYIEKSAVLFLEKPTKPSLWRENGRFFYEEGKNGRELSEELTLKSAWEEMENWNKSEHIEAIAVMEKIEPSYALEWLKQCNTLIGEYTTYYGETETRTAETIRGRMQNIENGAKKLNGILLFPNEIVSCYEILQPFTIENGYDTAGTYLQGRVVESIGGGVCQLSTTLYNAGLFAELEIIERQAHSMTVGYVPLARDSAIAGQDKDLKIQNNTDAPIYIESKTEDGMLTFFIYGKEKQKGREIRLETVVLETIEPGEDVIVQNNQLKKTDFIVVQTAHKGYKTELYKIVYQKGREIERVKLNTSNYVASPRYIETGMGIPNDMDS